jgi:hypothetical protein
VAALLALLAVSMVPLAVADSGRAGAVVPNDVATVFQAASHPTSISASYNQTSGTNYEGVGTYSGQRVLMFRFDGDDIQNMDMVSQDTDPSTPKLEVTAAKAHLKGNMEFYATSLSGSLFGLIPATFTPDFPPPITLPTLILTNFHADVVFIKCDTMELQGLNLHTVS